MIETRNPLVIANWKLNGGIELINSFVTSFTDQQTAVEIAIAPPYIYIRDLKKLLHNSDILVGAQDMSEYDVGAFTGEISGQMLNEIGASFSIIGHSERRQLFHESDSGCFKKVAGAFKSKLLPVLCIGENEKEKEAGLTIDVLHRQMRVALVGQNLTESELVVAYEPVWAIGSGKAATPLTVQDVHAYIRSELCAIFDKETSQRTRIIYGGSVNKRNAADLLLMPDIDGLLVGGASLDPAHFVDICKKVDACNLIKIRTN